MDDTSTAINTKIICFFDIAIVFPTSWRHKALRVPLLVPVPPLFLLGRGKILWRATIFAVIYYEIKHWLTHTTID